MSFFYSNLGYDEVEDSLCNKIIDKRIPINATITLTNYCNFKCLHCYVQSLKYKENNNLSFNQWKVILKMLKEKGCIYLKFTGGEILSSRDFIDLYAYAYDLNFQINLISNISLLNERHICLFEKSKPNKLFISLYGASNETYYKFCQIENGWTSIKNNIVKLLKIGINIELQTVLNTYNYNELKFMNDFAIKYNIPFHVYRTIVCEVDGNNRPLKYKVDVEQEIQSFYILNDLANLKKMIKNNDQVWEKGYKRCYAGIANCYIDPEGNMVLCNQKTEEKYNILEIGFDDCWEKIFKLRKKEIETYNICSACKNRNYCGKCSPTINKYLLTQQYPFEDCRRSDIIRKSLNI